MDAAGKVTLHNHPAVVYNEDSGCILLVEQEIVIEDLDENCILDYG